MKGWRTILFNVAAAILPVLQVSGTELGLSGNHLAIYAVGVNVANIVLRSITTTAIGKK